MDGDRRLVINTDSKTTLEALTKHAQRNEDSGFILQENGPLLRDAMACIRSRRTHVALCWVKGHSGHPLNEGADRLAAEGAAKEELDLDLRVPPEFKQTGAKLASMTQKLAYRAIRRAKDQRVEPRRVTRVRVGLVKEGVEVVCGRKPTEESIWRSLTTKHITRECRQFLWKVLHDAFMIGEKWLRPSIALPLRERAACGLCGATEDMKHILFECASEERIVTWELTEALWRATGEEWIEPGWGPTLGAACVTFTDGNGDRRPMVEARWTILATESAYLIWKMRCERVIQQGGKRFTRSEAVSRWRKTIEGRLKMDRAMVSEALGKRALQAQEVESIWLPLLQDSANLPLNWVRTNGVLAGIRCTA
ncbi:hypothetical protein FKP32DRAFT_1559974 [Trametes sanguinea]|nr:hypothetical protein FKP32DRAFT_1559974 [Trametes sanguinea]